MTSLTKQTSFHFSDGSNIEFLVNTNESSVARIFSADVSKRMRSVQPVDPMKDTPLRTYRSMIPEERTDDHQSTTTHSLPAGEVTVSIDASGKGIHGYLYTLATAAVAYTHAVDIQFEKASLLTAVLLAGALALVAFGRGLLSLSLFAVGGPLLLHVAVYWLSARGLMPSLSRSPTPVKPSF